MFRQILVTAPFSNSPAPALPHRSVMTRRKIKNLDRAAKLFREARIAKLLQRGWIRNAAEIPPDAIPVDPERIVEGYALNTPIFYWDQPFTCRDCGIPGIWEAKDQLWYFEVVRAPNFTPATRCLACRRVERARKLEARRRAGHGPSPPS